MRPDVQLLPVLRDRSTRNRVAELAERPGQLLVAERLGFGGDELAQDVTDVLA
jgi:hypothetical protein